MTNTWDTNHLESTKMWVEHFSKHLVTVETIPVPANQLSILNRQVSSAFTNDLRHLLNLRRSSDLESTQKAIIELLAAFKKLKVIKIMKLVARDNIRNPMEDRQIIETVRQFRVEELDWYKLDFDIYDLIPPDRLSNPQRQDFPGAKLRKIHLYTKGHQGVLHHWSGGDGLISLPQLQDVFITVIYGDERKSTIDKYARTENVEEKEKIFPEFHEVKVFHEARIAQEAAGKSRKLNVVISPGCRHKPRDIGSTKPENAADKFFEIFNRSSSLLKSLDSATPDRKIRVAVIDNGIDTGMGDLGGQVKQGHSFVECGVIQHWHADLNTLTKGRLPWFTATDPHGTQMAGLIAKINCLCELYVYRIHTNRHDIRMNAAKEVKSDSFRRATRP
ncbi:hypothetical protein GQ53DRAFT_359326 [Thozetella sp. PMI_491]|nr:hypothetical protein GQ53DRAFT_359326 [Thozetella sp. PMI_491]